MIHHIGRFTHFGKVRDATPEAGSSLQWGSVIEADETR
jgi:hypothetical protein